MKTTPKQRAEIVARLVQLGIAYHHAENLRRISMTLQRWFELECGVEGGMPNSTLSVEREGGDGDGDGKPFCRIQYMERGGKWIDRKSPVRDREKGARKRLASIMADYPDLVPYVQTDPRGCAVYVLKKSDVNGREIDSVYTRGIAVY